MIFWKTAVIITFFLLLRRYFSTTRPKVQENFLKLFLASTNQMTPKTMLETTSTVTSLHISQQKQLKFCLENLSFRNLKMIPTG